MKKIFLLIFLGLANCASSQYKTFKDSIFNKGDIIRLPEMTYSMCRPSLNKVGHNDSVLKSISEFVNAHKDIVFEIGSHTDTRGKAEANYTLSAVRSESIKQELEKNYGVDILQLKAHGYGPSKPVVLDSVIKEAKTPQEKEALHQKNRRIEIKALEIVDTIERITKIEMFLSAYGVEADDYPSIGVNIDLIKNTNSCDRSFFNPAYKNSEYTLTQEEINNVLTLLKISDVRKLKKRYITNLSDQPRSITIIYTTKSKYSIDDYGLIGDYPLTKVYGIVYKF